MKQIFKYKDFNVVVKTNLLKDGRSYFGKYDIQERIELVYRDMTFDAPELTVENKLMSMYKGLKKQNIKPLEVSYGDLTYAGVAMTDISKKPEVQTLLK